jgi:hypothetical protein
MDKQRYFCTLFDKNYLLKGVVMIRTLLRHCPHARVIVVCMDDEAFEMLGKLSILGVDLVRLTDVENEELLRVKPGRSIAEYCWTLTASICWHALETRPEIDMITYLDADLMFYSDVEPLFDEIGEKSVAIIEHRFMPRLAHLEAYGRYNVEWITFRRNDVGLACLKKWRDQCIEWCFARLEDGRMGDQKYLDSWPEDYPGEIQVLMHKGAGIAPWNFGNYTYTGEGRSFFVDGSPLIFYHFHQFQLLTNGGYSWMNSKYEGNDEIPAGIYQAYERELEAEVRRVRSADAGFQGGFRSPAAVMLRRAAQVVVPIWLKNGIRRLGIQMW